VDSSEERLMKKAAPWLMLGGVLLASAIALRVQGRLWICSCGYVALWCGDINSAGNSQHLFDPYTFTHIIHGFLFIALVHLLAPRLEDSWKIAGALSLEALWEVIENSTFIIERYRHETISLGYTGDTIVNSFGDLLACALGVLIARRLGVVKTIVLTVVIEIVLLIVVKDNLTLNIIMLLFPNESIRAWQMGK
jgi:Protein of unknown function (DUF2585)